MKVSSIKLLIDADVLIYACGFAAEHMFHKVFMKGDEEWGPVQVFPYKKEAVAWINGEDEVYYIESERKVEPLGNAIQALKTKLKSICYTLRSNNYQLYLTGKDNFRDKIATIQKYKGNRDPNHKPFYYKELRQYLINQWRAIVVDNYEADDALSMAQYKAEEGTTIIVSIDKDLKNVKGWNYNPSTKEKTWITEETATKNFYLQLLTGDRADNIRGIPGIGPKKAEKILEGCKTEGDMYWEILQKYDLVYEKPLEALIETARLLWMSKETPDDWKEPQ